MLIVVPFGRKHLLERLLTLWQRQTVKAPLVLVADEPGDWVARAEEAGAKVITGMKTIGAAKNAGTDLALSLGEEWVVIWDDDDYYGPRYIETIQSEITSEVDVLSLGIAFVRFDDGLYLFTTPLYFCPGHSTAYRVSTAPRFPEISLSEDVVWSKFIKAERAKHLPPWHLVYYRVTGQHAFKASQARVIQSFGEARRIGEVPDEFVDVESDVSGYPLVSPDYEAIFQEMEAEARKRCWG